MADDDKKLEKPVIWVGSSRDDIAAFPRAAKVEAGHQLHQVQLGFLPDDYKSMSIVGAGVFEIRIDIGEIYRVFYVAKFTDAIYVLHAFEKKTEKTASGEIALGRRRYSDVEKRQREIKRAQTKGKR